MPLGGSRLVQDYLAGSDSASPFYRDDPFQITSYRSKAAELDSVPRVHPRSALASLIRPAGPAGAEALRSVIEKSGYFVTTGQQPALFGGPLYSLYKAMTAVALAQVLEPVVGRPVMPLFWIASDDHDWEEANHSHVLDPTNRLHRLTLDSGQGDIHPALSDIPLGEAVTDLVAKMLDLFSPNDFRTKYGEILTRAFIPSATMASAFTKMMIAVLHDSPIGLVDAANLQLKEASRSILLAEAKNPCASTRSLQRTASALSEAGYDLQVPVLDGRVNLFTHSKKGRERLFQDGTNFKLRHSGRSLSAMQVNEKITTSPGNVSPNVLLRPVVESFIFPTLAYVGGPGEMAYFGQLGGLFRRHKVGVPVVFPRLSFTVLEAKVKKVLEKFTLTVAELEDKDAVLGRIARDALPEDVQSALARWKADLAARAAELSVAATNLDPTLKGAVQAARNTGDAAFSAMEKKLTRAAKRQNEIAVSQIRKAADNLWPKGKPQDRILGPMQYLMRYGDSFPACVLQEAKLAVAAKIG